MDLLKSSGIQRQAKTLQLRRPKPPPPRSVVSVLLVLVLLVSVLLSELLKTLKILSQTFGRITSFGLSIIGRSASNKMSKSKIVWRSGPNTKFPGVSVDCAALY
jgi:hypothetical protein